MKAYDVQNLDGESPVWATYERVCSQNKVQYYPNIMGSIMI